MQDLTTPSLNPQMSHFSETPACLLMDIDNPFLDNIVVYLFNHYFLNINVRLDTNFSELLSMLGFFAKRSHSCFKQNV